MSFSERLKSGGADSVPTRSTRKCTIAKAFEDERLQSNDQQRLKEAVESPKGHPGRVTSANIVIALRDEGIHVSTTMIDRHRRTVCGCYSPEKQG